MGKIKKYFARIVVADDVIGVDLPDWFDDAEVLRVLMGVYGVESSQELVRVIGLDRGVGLDRVEPCLPDGWSNLRIY